MSYTYGGGIPEVVAYPEPNRQSKQKLGAAVIGAVFIALMVAAVAAFISTGEWMMLAVAPLLGLALFGLGVSVKEKQLQRKVDLSKPALLLDDAGIGNGDAQIQWNDVAAVDTLVHFNRSVMPSAGRRLANKFTDTVGVLDGTFLVRVSLRGQQQLGGRKLLKPGRHGEHLTVFEMGNAITQARTPDLNMVVIDVGRLVNASEWQWLADAVRAHVQARGIHFGEDPRRT